MTTFLLAFALADVGDYSWRIAGVYDATAVGSLSEEEPTFVWKPYEGMLESCGPAKAPDGMGVFEAEAISSRLMPTLAIVLERNGGAPLGADDLRVAMGHDGPELLLNPMVQPRNLEIHVTAAPGAERVAQLVRTQLETETCMEHKTGRAWTGNEAGRVRQAFLLDPPSGMDASRKFFGGQQDPVPGLIGPPDACMRADGNPLRPSASGRGDGSLTLVPTDVWGASTRSCQANERLGMALAEKSRWLPLRTSGEKGPYIEPQAYWSSLRVEISLDGPEDEQARVDLTWSSGIPGEPALNLLEDAPLFEESEEGPPGIIDLLAKVPYRYPTLPGADDPNRYTVLLIPNWQIVEAARRLDAGHPDEPMRTQPLGVGDGVAYLLENPEMLYVQLRPESATEEEWPNLAGNLEGRILGEPWGYTVGALNGRSHIVTIARIPPSWEQALAAQRGDVFAALLTSVFIVLGVVAVGIRRLPDLVNPPPEERAHYWPGIQDAAVTDTPQNMPEEDSA